MSICSDTNYFRQTKTGSKVPSDHRKDKKDNPLFAMDKKGNVKQIKEPTKKEHTFRLKQLMLARLRVEFPMHDVSDLGMVVQRMWEDIETDTEAK